MPNLAPLLRRRPSAPMLVALLALFVALGGPAQASRFINGKLLKRGSVTTKQVKNHTLRTEDLAKKAVRTLKKTPKRSVGAIQIRNGAVTPAKFARGAVDSHAIADRAVQGGDIGLGAVGGMEVADGTLSGADVADGGLDARDIGRFWGRFTITVPPVQSGKCWSGDPVGLAPERANADISGDVIKVTPGAAWPGDLTFAARVSTTRSRFTIIACNPTWKPATPPTATPIATNVPAAATPVAFNYVVIDVP